MLRNVFKSFVYPSGKVHKNYGKYVRWSFVSNVIVSIESVLSTHSMLSMSGKASNELVLSVNYIGKDIVGQIGGLWYMNRMGKKADKNPKEFIQRSMFLQQSSIFVECATPLLPLQAFLPVAGIANMCKNISFTGFGAINAKIIQELSENNNNMGEIYAKISMINTLGSSIGMCIGLFIAYKIPDHSIRLGLVPLLAGCRMYSFRKSIQDINIESNK
jgi:hypothetical protein